MCYSLPVAKDPLILHVPISICSIRFISNLFIPCFFHIPFRYHVILISIFFSSWFVSFLDLYFLVFLVFVALCSSSIPHFWSPISALFGNLSSVVSIVYYMSCSISELSDNSGSKFIICLYSIVWLCLRCWTDHLLKKKIRISLNE